MASKRKEASDQARAETESRGLYTPPVQENMKTVSFQIRPSDYEALRAHFDNDMGMKIGQGIRFVLYQYLKDQR